MNTVLYDGSIFSRQASDGISNYLSNLINYGINADTVHLFKVKVIGIKGHSENLFLCERRIPSDFFFQTSAIGFFYRLFLGRLQISAKIFHSPYMFLPPKGGKHLNVLTIHDLINLENGFSTKNKIREILLRTAIARADYFICISNTTKQKLLDFFPHLDERRINVIYQGIDESFFSKEHQPSVYKPYILYVGRRNGYKNFKALLNFYKSFSQKNEIDIVCVGGGPFSKEEISQIKSLNIEKYIKHVGYVHTSELRILYQRATALFYTSLIEGFGLPIIEAMASQCPVVCGNFPAIKEVAGKHGIFLDNFSPDSFKEGLEKAMSLSTEAKINAYNYSKSFPWTRTAAKTFEFYQTIL